MKRAASSPKVRTLAPHEDDTKKKNLRYRIRNNWELYLLLVPVAIYYLVFHFAPMYGIVIAFKDYFPGQSIWKSPW